MEVYRTKFNSRQVKKKKFKKPVREQQDRKKLLIKKGEKKQQIFDINSYTMSQLGTVYATKRRRRNGKR